MSQLRCVSGSKDAVPTPGRDAVKDSIKSVREEEHFASRAELRLKIIKFSLKYLTLYYFITLKS